MLFVSPYKLFFFSKFVNFCLDAFGHIGIRLDRKAKVTFKIDDVVYRETNNYNKHIA